MQFVFYSNFNVYEAAVPERLHHCDIGLFKYQMEYTKECLRMHDSDIDKLIDQRLKQIPKHYSLKIFNNGINDLSRLTASEYRALMQQMVFVLDQILPNDNMLNKKLVNVFVLWNNMYMISKLDEFNESDLVLFKVIIITNY
jgi:hypothetical protein